MKDNRLSKEYILSRVTIDTVGWCWHWPQKSTINGYKVAQFGVGRANRMLVHRASYMAFVGPIENGLVIDHLCRNRACCNPDHLEKVSFQENLRRGANRDAPSCKYGHEYNEENTVYQKAGSGRNPTKMCRTCRNERFRKYRATGKIDTKSAQKKYRANNAEKIRAAQREWYKNNPDYYKKKRERAKADMASAAT